MFSQVVVGVHERDGGRDGGRDAIALAKNLVAPDGKLTFTQIWGGETLVYHSEGAALDEKEEQRALAYLEEARREALVNADLRIHVSPSVGRGLHELCDALAADLLVVGSSRRGLAGRVTMGDQMRSALNGAPCAVAIAPGGYSREPVVVREIGVGYDGSLQSQQALAVARDIAGQCGAKLSAFEAVSLPSFALASRQEPVEDVVKPLLDTARERIAALGGVEPHVTYGDPAEELALYSASLDLLVVGSRGYGPVGRLVHGSTSFKLAETARCPLLVLPRAAEASTSGAAKVDQGASSAVHS